MIAAPTALIKAAQTSFHTAVVAAPIPESTTTDPDTITAKSRHIRSTWPGPKSENSSLVVADGVVDVEEWLWLWLMLMLLYAPSRSCSRDGRRIHVRVVRVMVTRMPPDILLICW